MLFQHVVKSLISLGPDLAGYAEIAVNGRKTEFFNRICHEGTSNGLRLDVGFAPMSVTQADLATSPKADIASAKQ